ncbi:MAG: hypothetical protein AB1896_14345 [Thermodesulfobacteriota bacterium]
MTKPEYPTKEGLWSQGRRSEAKYAKVKWGLPYREAVENFRRACEGRDDFDPAVLFVWGTMQATGVLNVLKAVEERFGPEGQEVVRGAVNRAGYEAARGMLENSELPADLSDTELISFIVTGVNTILYASLEKPWITNEDRCEFDILWCPHQDRYTAFDCRVQRYFVEGMIRAIEEWTGKGFAPVVDKLIPRGADRCHFTMDQRRDEEGRHPWDKYSDELGRRAFEKLSRRGS